MTNTVRCAPLSALSAERPHNAALLEFNLLRCSYSTLYILCLRSTINRVRKTLNQNLPAMLPAAFCAEEHQAAADPERLGGIEPNGLSGASGKDGSAALNLPQDAEGWAQGFR